MKIPLRSEEASVEVAEPAESEGFVGLASARYRRHLEDTHVDLQTPITWIYYREIRPIMNGDSHPERRLDVERAALEASNGVCNAGAGTVGHRQGFGP
jgi:hypothetical protein